MTKTVKQQLIKILKRSREFPHMHKEGNKLCIIYPLIYGSVLVTFYSPRNQTASCQYKLSKINYRSAL